MKKPGSDDATRQVRPAAGQSVAQTRHVALTHTGRHPPPAPEHVCTQAQEESAVKVLELYSGGVEGNRRNRFVQQNSNSLGFVVGGKQLSIKQNRDLQGKPGITGAALWDAALILCKYLEGSGRARIGLRPESVCLELGSGCGLVGIAVAMGLGVKHVDITDIRDMLTLLEQNVKANQSHARVSELCWGDGSTYPSTHYDVILASDCVYHENFVPWFIDALVCTSRPDTTIVICMELRDSEVTEGFLELVFTYFHLEQVPLEEMDEEYRCEAVVIFLLKKKVEVDDWLAASPAHRPKDL